jgi:hypothetical protein
VNDGADPGRKPPVEKPVEGPVVDVKGDEEVLVPVPEAEVEVEPTPFEVVDGTAQEEAEKALNARVDDRLIPAVAGLGSKLEFSCVCSNAKSPGRVNINRDITTLKKYMLSIFKKNAKSVKELLRKN